MLLCCCGELTVYLEVTRRETCSHLSLRFRILDSFFFLALVVSSRVQYQTGRQVAVDPSSSESIDSLNTLPMHLSGSVRNRGNAMFCSSDRLSARPHAPLEFATEKYHGPETYIIAC